MITKDSPDFYSRLWSLLPPWFGDHHPNLDVLLKGGAAVADEFIERIYQFAKLQTRIKTATGEFLDLIAQDFFGEEVRRRAGENDATYRTRILAALLQEKATRQGLEQALTLLTGTAPILFEPWRPLDCGGYHVPSALAYSRVGKYGSHAYPYQAFATVFVPPFTGMVEYAGYHTFGGGYNAAGGLARGSYGSNSLVQALISDEDIYELITQTQVFSTMVWTRIIRDKIHPLYDE